jgi:hypothetical protein
MFSDKFRKLGPEREKHQKCTQYKFDIFSHTSLFMAFTNEIAGKMIKYTRNQAGVRWMRWIMTVWLGHGIQSFPKIFYKAYIQDEIS